MHVIKMFYIELFSNVWLFASLKMLFSSNTLCYFDSHSFLCPGWRFGAVYGKSGVFPSDYMRPVAAPDFLILPADRAEPRDRQGQVAASAAIAVAMGSSVAAQELDLSTEVRS